MNARILVLPLIFALGSVAALSGARPQAKRPIRESEMNAVIEAIQDEIYDLKLQNDFFELGPSPKDHRLQVVLNVYFQPDVIEDSRSWVVYKLMPGGEVLRMFEIGRTGRIYLNLKPGEFRVTQPSYPTVYMDDDELCKIKHDWIKRQFVVDTNPSEEVTAAARARQLDRKQHTFGPAGEPPDANR